MSAIASIGQRVGDGQMARKRRRRRGEPIEMVERRDAYFPHVFLWRGHQYRVYAVNRCWTVSRRSRSGRLQRHCFRVTCNEGTFELFQDVRHNSWHLLRQVAL